MVINFQKISILVEIHLDIQDTNQDPLKDTAESWVTHIPDHIGGSPNTQWASEKNTEWSHWKFPYTHVAALTSLCFPGFKKKKKLFGFQYHHSGNSCPTDLSSKWTVTAYLNVRVRGKGQGIFSQFQNSDTDKRQQSNRLRQLFLWQSKFLLLKN